MFFDNLIKLLTMKKILAFTFLVFLAASLSVKGQIKLGLKFSPILVDNRSFDDEEDLVTTSTENSTLGISLGLVVDKEITDSYSFSTGLIYTPKRLKIRRIDSSIAMPTVVDEEYRTQYIQIPLTFKLYTNEVSPGIKVYFQVGVELEALVFDEALEGSSTLVSDFSFFDTAVVLGAGVEYKLGASNILFGGLSYHRGLLDITKDNFAIRNTTVSLDLGIKF